MFIKSKYIVLEDRVLENGALEIDNGKIKSILESSDKLEDCIDYGDSIIGPGFVDTHIHGYSGHILTFSTFS